MYSHIVPWSRDEQNLLVPISPVIDLDILLESEV